MYIVARDLTERAALELEAKLIHFLGTRYEQGSPGPLVNIDFPLRALRTMAPPSNNELQVAIDSTNKLLENQHARCEARRKTKPTPGSVTDVTPVSLEGSTPLKFIDGESASKNNHPEQAQDLRGDPAPAERPLVKTIEGPISPL